MKITKELLYEMIKEELVALQEQAYLRHDQLTPEQQVLRNKKVMQFLKDPAVQELQTKYGIFLSKVPKGNDLNSYDLLNYFGLDAKAAKIAAIKAKAGKEATAASQKALSDVLADVFPNLKK